MINLKNLTVKISGKEIVKGVSFHVPRGLFFALIGPNGSGKSTVVKVLARTLEASSGEIDIMGRSHRTIPSGEYAGRLAVMSQHHDPVRGLKAYDRVAYGRIPHTGLFGILKKRDHDLIESAMKETDVWGLKDRDLSQLSGGELQRVYLAACFAQEPEILILDEPTNHLDIKHQINILSLIKQRAETTGLTVLCVLHDINQTFRFADRVGMMKEGCLKACGSPQDVINGKNIMDLYGMESHIHKIGDSVWVDFKGVV